ncbi:bifunctional pyr operon transcriptional regulator/uracil phosphoribosyltransferase PyrR [Bacteroidia bacterium]|nr:bifunctional pyr operon transcriptional regulator/uracil phosphoribosyltransferase PyrR [Bacteroidia bacterium]MDC1395886.1 bifunctional pyr operon transcriptional regulator/uracil phosphoribosyltransferase PyrR [Bacteroidia bacterium]
MKRIILKKAQIDLILTRICHQLVEDHGDFSNTALIALQPRGILFGKALRDKLNQLFNITVTYGELDTTFHRDDFRRTDKPLIPNTISLDFEIEAKRIILVDDVLYTGRSIRAALDAINDYGRPASIELVTLINRKFKREVPIHPDYVGEHIDSRTDDYVKVDWNQNECQVWIITDSDK